MALSMRRALRSTLLTACAAAACLLFAAPLAFADSPLEQYQRTGRVDPCTASGSGGIPNDIEQYAPDFKAALQDALRQGCDKGGAAVSQTQPTETTKDGIPVAAGGGGTLPPGSRYVPKPPAPPKVVHDDKVVRHQPLAATGDTKTPTPVTALGILVLVALALGAGIALGRYLGWSAVDRLGGVRGAFGELGLRLRGLTRRA
jgi:hypothetical protein